MTEEELRLTARCESYKGQVEAGAAQIERLRAALKRIARHDYDDYAGNPTKWAPMIAYRSLGGRHKDGVALDPELLGQPSSVCEASDGGSKSG